MDEHLTTNQVNCQQVSNMTGYKRSISDVKMDRGSPICNKLHLKISEISEKCSLKKLQTLMIPPSTVNNIIKGFRECALVHEGQGQRSKLDVGDLHCNKSRHSVTGWAQTHFQKSLSMNTVRHAICKHNPEKLHRLLWTKAPLKWPEAKGKTVL